MKKSVIFVLFGSLLLISLVGVSYAYFFGGINGHETTSTIITDSSQLELTYTDGTGTISGSEIAPGWSSSKNFQVSNTGKGTANFKIYISNINNQFMANSIAIRVMDTSDNSIITDTVLPSAEGTISEPISIAMGATKTYTLTVYYQNLDFDQTADMGKSFSFTVSIANSH